MGGNEGVMPKERIYTSTGYIEVSWYGGGGGLICIESAAVAGHGDRCDSGDYCGESSNCPPRLAMHQITDKGSMKSLLKVLRRANRQEFEPVSHDGHGCLQDPTA